MDTKRHDELVGQMQAKITDAKFHVFLTASPKQQLLMLQDAKLLTKLQVGAIARRMGQLQAQGDDAAGALEASINELFDGTIEIGVKRDAQARAGALKLSELRKKIPDLSAKQTLLELRNAGSISPVQTKKAAQLLAKGLTVEQALAEVGATHLLDTPPPAVEPEEAPEPTVAEIVADMPGPTAPTPEPVEDEAAEAVTPEAEKVRTIGDLLDQSVDQLAADLEKIKVKGAVTQLYILEEGGKTRKSAKAAIKAHGATLGLTDDDFDRALEIHRQSTDGTPVQEAYVDHPEDDEDDDESKGVVAWEN